MKLLLYCTKAKPYLVSYKNTNKHWYLLRENEIKPFPQLNTFNGKIVAECDFEVEWCDTSWYCSDFIEHKGLEKSCLTKGQLFDYVKGRHEFYAIHIKNLHIFDKPKELNGYSDYFLCDKDGTNRWEQIRKAPQNMCRVFDIANNKYILISIRPEWLCKILNGEKTIEVRKKVLKGMVK